MGLRVPLKFHVGERLTVSRPGGIFSRLQRLGGDAPGLVDRERVCQRPAALLEPAKSESKLPARACSQVLWSPARSAFIYAAGVVAIRAAQQAHKRSRSL